jgi:MFS transporter, ACS family, allantoate permease
MADMVDSEKVASDPKTASLNQETKSGDKAPRINKNGDDALQLIESASPLDSLDPQISKRLLRRIDIYIMPLICT